MNNTDDIALANYSKELGWDKIGDEMTLDRLIEMHWDLREKSRIFHEKYIQVLNEAREAEYARLKATMDNDLITLNQLWSMTVSELNFVCSGGDLAK